MPSLHSRKRDIIKELKINGKKKQAPGHSHFLPAACYVLGTRLKVDARAAPEATKMKKNLHDAKTACVSGPKERDSISLRFTYSSSGRSFLLVSSRRHPTPGALVQTLIMKLVL